MAEENRIIRVLLVDDHAVLRSGMKFILEVVDTVEVIGEASNGLEAIEQCEALSPDIILMDLMMPEMDGVEATKVITKKCPRTRIIILTSFDEENKVSAALNAGAVSYLIKNISAEGLTEAIEKAYQGIPTIAPEAAQALAYAQTSNAEDLFDLSDRELQVLEQLAMGITNKEIAKNLEISGATVKRHVSNILAKMKVISRTEAVTLAIKHDLIHS